MLSALVFCNPLQASVAWLLVFNNTSLVGPLLLVALFVLMQMDAFYRSIKKITYYQAFNLSIMANLVSAFVAPVISLVPLGLLTLLPALNNFSNNIWLYPVIFYWVTIFMALKMITHYHKYTTQQLLRPLLIGQLISHILLYSVVMRFLHTSCCGH